MSRRLNKELQDTMSNPPPGCQVDLSQQSQYIWNAHVYGPADTPYEGGIFRFTIEFTSDYPMAPVILKSKTKVYHPNICDDGRVAITMLRKEKWRPNITINMVLEAIVELLKNPTGERAFVDVPHVTDIARVFNEDKEKFKQTAREWTEKYAQ